MDPRLTERQQEVFGFIQVVQRGARRPADGARDRRALPRDASGGLRPSPGARAEGISPAAQHAGRTSRALTLAVPPSTAREVPILGRIAAGAPLLAEENREGTLPLDPAWVGGRGDDVFGLRVRGESMINAHIVEGDSFSCVARTTPSPATSWWRWSTARRPSSGSDATGMPCSSGRSTRRWRQSSSGKARRTCGSSARSWGSSVASERTQVRSRPAAARGGTLPPRPGSGLATAHVRRERDGSKAVRTASPRRECARQQPAAARHARDRLLARRSKLGGALGSMSHRGPGAAVFFLAHRGSTRDKDRGGDPAPRRERGSRGRGCVRAVGARPVAAGRVAPALSVGRSSARRASATARPADGSRRAVDALRAGPYPSTS